ncbi:exopolysaccharide biosynthesis protein [Ensifer sp. LC13]|nr:exopolysaccharide biosynthesis protein [Ensifer sp. LC13]OCP11305.1 exopolysaccharide biosynthesis protein [Ensifer sp. LC11]OCP14699.1 exopolysaccharide biosynthesis protein [Ensifer sp. LC14]OCP33188.1 exopolysaccharide biosynthesis protein [Ensifer sp. LC499]
MLGGWAMLVALAIGAYFADRLPMGERAATGEVSGLATASDGDSLRIDGKRVRIEGIDAPELAQTCQREGIAWQCGRQARDRLRALLSAGDIKCRFFGRDRYGRDLGACEAGGRDVGREMVLAGYAVSYGRYEAEEARAEKEKRGIWAGEFVAPQEWRRTNGQPDEAPHVIDGWIAAMRRWLLERLTALFAGIGDG